MAQTLISQLKSLHKTSDQGKKTIRLRKDQLPLGMHNLGRILALLKSGQVDQLEEDYVFQQGFSVLSNLEILSSKIHQTYEYLEHDNVQLGRLKYLALE